jgi:hypothetical protein
MGPSSVRLLIAATNAKGNMLRVHSSSLTEVQADDALQTLRVFACLLFGSRQIRLCTGCRNVEVTVVYWSGKTQAVVYENSCGREYCAE